MNIWGSPCLTNDGDGNIFISDQNDLCGRTRKMKDGQTVPWCHMWAWMVGKCICVSLGSSLLSAWLICPPNIRSFILWSWRNLEFKPGVMGAHCLHPLVGRTQQHTCLCYEWVIVLKMCLSADSEQTTSILWCLFMCEGASQHQLHILTKIGALTRN